MKENKYKGRVRRWLIEIVVFVVAIFAIFTVISHFLIRPAGSELSNKDLKSALTQKRLNYVAIGDSLTEGVGDQTNQGGFIPLLSNAISEISDVNVVSQNFGVAGNTSTQIYKRMTKEKKIQSAIKKADVITITVGGNDVMKVIRTQLTNLTENSFEKPAQTYQKQLTEIFDFIRDNNPNAQVYVLGIYNPFYLNFPDITEMQDIINHWNQTTQETIAQQKQMYFVPINDLLYQGVNGSKGVTTSDGEVQTITNNALFEEDHFHPNNIGYQIMSDAVAEAYKEHHNEK
ncbi:MAG: SGNH/GDSL hydrolase family protein [Lactococcus raffinolactis]|jgi:lysophospholipase L1-like esterase|uniref:GDSL family lipase n=1 Tax=Pseudolactococcus raffinolactis TaxID=1366 RepID=A0A2A5S6X8_9LACT|nr:SGNH/GDSL hydrolase family protein [Lactococcus raffinolactis]MBP6301404.1 SGNH/GDSL hydrolase family protein [Lactococcus sp.]MBR2541757.1 SGNH/GDSL hydrolase family protein [Lactococcus sp.]MBW9298246.1 GDSL family lipase [Lactococcus raffinolactis]MCH4162334.1 SGNH/GDSL hydrolase family protein [Lactococcus raffinolactis]MDG4961703.1 SGNH/GDSL hydrolase family protein [Lactococcus raffinolactis]